MAMALLLGVSLTACGDSPSSGGADDTKTQDDNADQGAEPAGGSEAAPSADQDAEPAGDSGAAAGGDVANKDKPLVWFNRQPSNSSTGELDMAALNFNGNTYYVGFDANQGAELQGTMVKDYIEANIDSIDRNGDGEIGRAHV